MIVSDALQGSPEWLQIRSQIPTGSQAHRFVTDSGKLRLARTGNGMAGGAESYLNELLAAWLIGQPVTMEANAFMERGSEMEAEAANWYAFDRDVSIETIGFCTTDCGRFGASPDRVVGERGLLEIKVPGIVQQVANIREMTDEHDIQVQCQLFVTGREWCDLVSYNPTLPSVVKRIELNQEFMLNFHESLFGDEGFCSHLASEKMKLIQRGYEPHVPPEPINLDPDPTVDILEVLF